MVNIPIEAHFLTLTVGHDEIVERTISHGKFKPPTVQRQKVTKLEPFAPTRTADGLRKSLLVINTIFAPAGVTFQLRSVEDQTVPAPGSSQQLDDPGFTALAAKFPAPSLGGVSLLLVRKFQGAEAGAAVEKLSVCAVGDDAPDASLAHELGHLLNLDHQGDIRDLMNGGLSVPSPLLSKAEIKSIQTSPLYKRMANSQVSATPAAAGGG